MENKNKDIKTNKIINFLNSIKLAITLLAALAIASIVGTLIPQTASQEELLAHYGPVRYNIFNFLRFFDLYHSWWYVGLLAILAVNLLLCSIKSISRLSRVFKSPRIRMTDECWKGLKNRDTFTLKGDLHNAITFLSERLKKERFSLKEEKEEKKAYLFAQKGTYSYLGVYLAHLSILIIFAGAVISFYFGINGYMNITKGSSGNCFYLEIDNRPSALGFAVRCDDFVVEYYDDQKERVKDYLSTLTIIDQGKEVLKKKIEVNDPLEYKGFRLFQSYYGKSVKEGRAVLVLNKGNDQTFTPLNFELGVGEEKAFLEGKNAVKIKLLAFEPDFYVEGPGKYSSKSDQFNNPAAQVAITYEGVDEPVIFWIFQRYPDVQMSKTKIPYLFNLLDYKASEYTGLQVAKDPGANVVWTGSILLVIGLLVAFFTSDKRIWCTLERQGENTLVKLGGSASKNMIVFERYFGELVGRLNNTCNGAK
ncbi:MAG: cytochrome c biogenesis protein ResB [bacterium]